MVWNVRLTLPVILATKWGQARPRLVTGEAKAAREASRLLMPECPEWWDGTVLWL